MGLAAFFFLFFSYTVVVVIIYIYIYIHFRSGMNRPLANVFRLQNIEMFSTDKKTSPKKSPFMDRPVPEIFSARAHTYIARTRRVGMAREVVKNT